MATPQEIRRRALQALYQLDARGDADAADVRATLDDIGLSRSEADDAMRIATGAFEERAEADRAVTELAPGWPAHRQPAIDRAIFRLAHWELAHRAVQPSIAINAAVELAKEFSTDRSPPFINAVLDKIAAQLAERSAGAQAGDSPS